MKRALSLTAALLLMTAVSSCGGGPFTIGEWHASSSCTADGTMEILESGNVRSLGEIQYHMSSSGMPSIWCEGLVHRWPTTGEIEGYEFSSDPGDPLEFTVGADGYQYLAGAGTVTTPEGKVVELP